jgi:ornithine cyclodeaminase
MKLLSDEDVRSQLSWPKVLTALENAFKTRAVQVDYFKMPERVGIGVPQGTYLTMPCADQDGWFGIKQVSVIPENPKQGLPSIHAWYTLMSPQGVPAMAANASLLTKFRTSAVSAIAANHLANPEVKTLLVVGTGALAPWMAEAHAQVRTYKRIVVWGRDSNKARVTASEIARTLAKDVEVTEQLEAAVKSADVITMATTSRSPILKGDWLKEGQHIDLVGAFIPEMLEVDAATILKSEVFVDDLNACKIEAGDLIQAQRAGWSFDKVRGDLAQMVSAQSSRSGPSAITLFKSVGLALEDLVVAKLLS